MSGPAKRTYGGNQVRQMHQVQALVLQTPRPGFTAAVSVRGPTIPTPSAITTAFWDAAGLFSRFPACGC